MKQKYSHYRACSADHRLSPAQLRAHVTGARAIFAALNQAREAAMTARLEKARQQFGLAAAALEAMSPLKVLERGYAIAQDARGQVVREASGVFVGDAVRVRLWKGSLDCRVEKAEG